MKHATIILIVLASFATAQTDSIRGNQFTLEGEIINGIWRPPGCGTTAWGMVVEFSIREFSDSTYTLDSIPVIFTCPGFYGEGFFKVGEIYSLTLADENQANFGWVILNKFVLEKYTLEKQLWVIEAEKSAVDNKASIKGKSHRKRLWPQGHK
ncbi:MAG: hypothetical protein AAGI38_20575 [Bacteroidota bacterium]